MDYLFSPNWPLHLLLRLLLLLDTVTPHYLAHSPPLDGDTDCRQQHRADSVKSSAADADKESRDWLPFGGVGGWGVLLLHLFSCSDSP